MSTIKTETLSTPSNATVPVDTVVNGTAKAWVNFNGTGTVAIRRAFNVSSITDNAEGTYTVNFTTAMPDANYSATASSGTNHATSVFSANDGGHCSVYHYTTNSVRIITGTYGEGITNNFSDAEAVSVSIFS